MSGAPGPGRAPLPCTARAAAHLQLPGGAEAARPGVAVIDVRFPCGGAADVHEIVFKNFYTAFLSVRAQRAGPPGPRKWLTCLRDLRLMPCPHTELGAQEYFSLRRSQMLCDMEQVTALRFILRQPSPAWLHFGIEELQLFPPGSKTSPQDVPSWLSQLSPPERPLSLHGVSGAVPCRGWGCRWVPPCPGVHGLVLPIHHMAHIVHLQSAQLVAAPVLPGLLTPTDCGLSAPFPADVPNHGTQPLGASSPLLALLAPGIIPEPQNHCPVLEAVCSSEEKYPLRRAARGGI
ncbi:nicolin-1 isoform X1 [Lagopus leucura]|uniref:nicolin-1 isoform X1 n=1 Tax=Lagopus leucura TaxID=30410 RepID=UPI001C6712E0|nr:nicolin-1 isoform X1 [Lagopus leucura]